MPPISMARLPDDRWYRRAIDPLPIAPHPCAIPACSSSALGERRCRSHGRTARSDGLQPRRLFIGAKSRPLYNNVRPRSIQNVPKTKSIVFRIVILRRRGNGNSPQPWQPVSASIISPSTAPVSVVFRSLSAVQIPLIRECKFVDIWLSDSALKQLIYLYL